ncbi:hypothetical protein FA13DRAFT_1647235 [Coprinellus micaceus]|uniref:Uncharacterized protein n=1 Tax=Coprinellus micaceus TaxID=71717 RepID=A0A4Y7SCQ5_COPMI|nr:hypothetical protein FA13DRAFT_1647235 [Coprinellus micaceus]
MAESSPFSSYLGMNHAPSDNEIDLLKEFIENQLSSVGDLTRRIQEAKGAPAAELEARRNAHLKLIEDHSRLPSPIHRIPDEILSLIFTFCLESVVTTKYGPGLSRRHISVVLSHVSMLWRDLALRNPVLWSHVPVRLPPFRCINILPVPGS